MNKRSLNTDSQNSSDASNRFPQRVVYLTAGAGGMFCGSCLNDNTLARELTKLGVDIQLIPTYTPITTDEEDVSIDQVFFGGINVFLQQKFPPLRLLPAAFDRFLNHPRLIRWATKKDVQADPKLLGDMTVSMLKGSAGFQKKEVKRLLNFLDDAQPQVVNFTNSLIAGCAPEIKKRLQCPIVVTLQGDDIFLDYIPKSYAEQSIRQISALSESIDAYVVHSAYYADYMSDRLGIPRSKMHVVKLGIDANDFSTSDQTPPSASKTKSIGYLARLTPEKGFHVLTDAFIRLREKRDDVELKIAGWLGTEHQQFAEEQFSKLRSAGLEHTYSYLGVVSRTEKLDFLNGLDIFTVPTTYREPKGRFALEAMACGLPLVLPNHGAFPEMIAESGCGVLVRPNDADHLAEELNSLLNDHERCHSLGAAGRESVLANRNGESMARETLKVYAQLR